MRFTTILLVTLATMAVASPIEGLEKRTGCPIGCVTRCRVAHVKGGGVEVGIGGFDFEFCTCVDHITGGDVSDIRSYLADAMKAAER